MSQSPATTSKSTYASVHKSRDNNKNNVTENQIAKTFISWYKQMIDNERQNLSLYLSDDAILEWFGRTIKTRKKVSAFLKHDMQCSKHDFVSFQCIDKIQSRYDRTPRKEEKLSSLQHSPEVINSKNPRKRLLRSNCSSPEWAEGCQPPDELKEGLSKKFKSQSLDVDSKNDVCQRNGVKRGFNEDSSDVNGKGDGLLERRVKRKLIASHELGQGDCIPSTSGANSDRPQDTLNGQLPKLFVECNGYIQFMRTRNCNSRDVMKWERKCKAQISYSVDPLNVGEYIIWAIHYTDESKCRRNLLSAFEEVAKDELKKMSIDS